MSQTENTRVETVTAIPGTIAGDILISLIYASHSFADPEHVTSCITSVATVTPNKFFNNTSDSCKPNTITNDVNTPGVSDTNLAVDTVQVQNNDAEQSTSIADNALHVKNANNELENIKKQNNRLNLLFHK